MSQRMSFDEEWEEYIESERRHMGADPRGWFVSFARQHRHRDRRWVCFLLNEWEDTHMARGSGSGKNGGRAGGDAWTTFVDIRITSEDWEEMNATPYSPEEMSDDVSTLLTRGYRLSFSYNQQNDATIASLTCKAEGDVNEGKTLTAFAQGWLDALRLVLWKNEHIARGNWSKAAKERGGAVFG